MRGHHFVLVSIGSRTKSGTRVPTPASFARRGPRVRAAHMGDHYGIHQDWWNPISPRKKRAEKWSTVDPVHFPSQNIEVALSS